MTGLFEQVLHHLEGNETETQNWQTADGIKTVEFHSFGPDRWIESVHERSRMTGIECLAMILFEIDTSLHNPEPARRIVEAWAVELRKAATTGEIQARNPVTLLALETVPDGLEWLLSMADADKFIAARGMDWRFADVALQLFKECEQSIQNRRFPPWMRTAPAQNTATPAPVVPVSDEPAKRRRKTWRDVTEAYLECTFKELQCPTVKEFFAALTRKAGNGSPFDKGIGQNSGSLFARDVSAVVTCKMIEGFVTELRKKM